MDKDVNSLIRLAKEGDKGAMTELVEGNEKLVWSIVKRFSGRGMESADLFQTGCIGLIKAVKNFDFEKNVCFSTYAVPMIMGEIRKLLRDDGAVKVSRSIKQLGMKIRYASDEISKETGKTASLSEIADRLGMSCEETAFAISACEPPVSMHQPLGDNLTVMDTIRDKSDFEEKIIDRIFLSSATEMLDSRDRSIIVMRYFHNKTQTQIADMLGISQVQVSRLEKKIIERLRRESG